MSTTSLTAAQVMDKAAALMNDAAKTTYTYIAQAPYLNMAFDELQESFELNNIPITNQTTASIAVPIGVTQIDAIEAAGVGIVTYPVDLVEIQQLFERLAGTGDSFIPMVQREFLPHATDVSPGQTLQYWIWQDQKIKFAGAVTPREVKLDYIKTLFPTELVGSSIIGVINARSFLYYRTAALCAQFIGENENRASDLNHFAELALDRVTGIGVKGKQSIVTRRRPFMSSYKRRGFG